MITVVTETPEDAPAIETLLDNAFRPRRRMKTAARLRHARPPAHGPALVPRPAPAPASTLRGRIAAKAERGKKRRGKCMLTVAEAQTLEPTLHTLDTSRTCGRRKTSSKSWWTPA